MVIIEAGQKIRRGQSLLNVLMAVLSFQRPHLWLVAVKQTNSYDYSYCTGSNGSLRKYKLIYTNRCGSLLNYKTVQVFYL